jgi:hypothetical protein
MDCTDGSENTEYGHEDPGAEVGSAPRAFAYGVTAVGVVGAFVMLSAVALIEWHRSPLGNAIAVLFWTLAAVVLIGGLLEILAKQRIILEREFITLPQRRFVPRGRRLHWTEIESYSVHTGTTPPPGGRGPRRLILVRSVRGVFRIESRLCTSEAMVAVEQWLRDHNTQQRTEDGIR